MIASYLCNLDVYLGLTCQRKPRCADLYGHTPLISTYLPGGRSMGCFTVDCSTCKNSFPCAKEVQSIVLIP